MVVGGLEQFSVSPRPLGFGFGTIKTSERSCSLYLIQRQIGGSHNAYFKQESSLYLLLKEIQLFVCLGLKGLGLMVWGPGLDNIVLPVPFQSLIFPFHYHDPDNTITSITK